MNVLVTGAAGFIGSHLCERLLAEDFNVIGIDNFDRFYEPDIKKNNIRACLQNSAFELIEGDIRDSNRIETVCKRQPIDIIVHLAAKVGVRPSIEDPLGYSDVNINGTAVMLEAAKKHKISKIIFASSSSVYGNNKKIPFCETDCADSPVSPYAATKKAGEQLCYTYHHLYGMDITCLRSFTAYGPRQRPDLAIYKFAHLIEAGKPVPVFGDGSMRRDFTYIEDIIDGIIAAIKHCSGYEIYNLGCSEPVRVDKLISQLERMLQKKAVINHLPMQPGDVMQTYADITKAGKKLGYAPATKLAAGLDRFIEWMRKTAI